MRSLRFRTMGATAGAVAMLVTAGVSGATAAPETRLPDPDVWCSGVVATADDVVLVPRAGRLWIEDDELAGHYVILRSQHFFSPGLHHAPPAILDGLPGGEVRDFGHKAGMTDRTMECTVVSRFDMGPDSMTVFAPTTVVEVPSR